MSETEIVSTYSFDNLSDDDKAAAYKRLWTEWNENRKVLTALVNIAHRLPSY